MSTEPGSEQTVTQVENLIVVSMMDKVQRDRIILMAWALLFYLDSQVRITRSQTCLHACMCFSSGNFKFQLHVEQLDIISCYTFVNWHCSSFCWKICL